MSRHAPATTLQQRHAIIDLTAAGHSAAQIAQALACSIHTVRKWRRLHRRGASLSPRIGRAPTGALSLFPPALAAALRQMRQAHPGWGPTTLLLDLRRDPYWQTQPLPHRTQIAAFLKQQGFTRSYQKHHELPRPPSSSLTQPHQEWQLDAQGVVTVAGLGHLCPINIVDVVSHLKVESFPALDTRQPKMADYQLVLRRAFTAHGLPQRISFDHGSSFFDNTTPSPYPTRLHLWLVGLGVEVVFTRRRRPTDHAQVERMHQTMAWQALLGQRWEDGAELWAEMDARRAVLNSEMAMAVLGQRAPLEVFPEAEHSGREYRVEWEAELLELGRVDRYLAGGKWYRHTNGHGEFWLGQQRYTLGRRHAKEELVLQYDAAGREFVWEGKGGGGRLGAKGLSVEELMGEYALVVATGGYQLALPFTREAWRRQQLAAA